MNEGKRKLAAIMFTDIVGYSAVSHKNEPLALELLEEHRTLVRPLLSTHGGREIKTIGDAFLVEFESADSAVRCAAQIQARFEVRNRNAPPEKSIQLRIGIHLGDIVSTGNDVYGDGVNITARLMTAASPGTICVSSHVHDQIQNKQTFQIVHKGARRLKNIGRPIEIYEISPTCGKTWANGVWNLRYTFKKFALATGAVALLVTGVWGTHQALTRMFSKAERVAVLPFTNISRNAEDEYLSDGITEEVISTLSRIPGYRVMARTSVMRYKEQPQFTEQIRDSLKVKLLVEGSVRKSGDKLRVSVKLIDATTQESLWAYDLDGEMGEAFDMQKQIARAISTRLHGRQLASGTTSHSATATSNVAYLSYLKGLHFFNKRNAKGVSRSIELFKEAIATEPNFVPALSGLAIAHVVSSFYGYMDPKVGMPQGEAFARKALALDPQSVDALISIADKKAYFDHDWEGAEKIYQQALEIDPNHSTALRWYSEYLVSRGRFKQARRAIARAVEIDPLSMNTTVAVGYPDYYEGRYAKALRHFKETSEMNGGFALAFYWAGKALLRQKRYDEALPYLEKATRRSGEALPMKAALAEAYALKGDQTKAKSLLNEILSAPHSRIPYYELAAVFTALDEKEKALEMLETSQATHSPKLIFAEIEPSLAPLRSHPRFLALIRRMSQP